MTGTSEALHTRIGTHLSGSAFIGPAPGVMPGISFDVVLGVERPGLWAPAALLGFSHAWRPGVEAQGGTAHFELDALHLDLCPLRFRLGFLEARPCASALAGRFSALGTETLNRAEESHRPFAVLGGAALLSVELGWLIEASARLTLGANLVRDRFTFTPNEFHEVSAMSISGSIGFGVRSR